MRQPLIRRAQPGTARNVPLDIPAPFGGINALAGLAGGMEAFDAIDLLNWTPIDGGVETRPGYKTVATLGTGAPVQFFSRFEDGGGLAIVASGGKVFSLHRDENGVTAHKLGEDFGSDRWNSAVLNRRLFLVNGIDAPQAIYEGAITPVAFTKAEDEVVNLDLTKLFRVRAHAKRLFFAEKGSAAFWHTAAPGNVQGALKRFDLSGIGNRGGTIDDIVTITPDGAREGDDDAIVFFMSSGDAIMYRGSAPDDASGWYRVGVFSAARPIASMTYGGDVLTVSTDGYAELSRLLPSGRSPVAGFGTKLGRLARTATDRFGRRPGWHLVYDPARRLIVVHVPQTDQLAEQHVMNAATGAWGRWADLPAAAWGHIGDDLAFGTLDGRIALMTGANDDGKAIVARGQGSWQRLGASGRRKKVNGVRLVVTSKVSPALSHILAADFQDPTFSAPSTLPEDVDVGRWDASVWDKAVWGGAERVTASLRGGGIIGNFIAIGLRAETTAAPVRWISTQLLLEAGGIA